MNTILAPDGRPARRSAELTEKSWHGVYEAASRADFRGWFWLPTLDPAEQGDAWTRRTLAERSDWLYKNVGAVTMAIDGLALDEVGTGLWPKWNTESEDFNKAMTDAFDFANGDPLIFSADGQSDVYSMQYAIRRVIRLYGDGFGQMIDALPATGMPAMSLIPGYRVDNHDEPKGTTRRDGVRIDRFGRPIDYRVIERGEKGNTHRDVPASEMLHFHDPFLPGQVRGMPALASVAKRLFRREDIYKAIANGTLARERMGFAIQADPKGGLSAPVIDFGGEGKTETVENEDGSRYTVQKIFGEKANEEIVIPHIPAGARIEVVESNRPGTAVTEFLDSILREVSWATTYPPEYIFFLAGMGQGTAVRLVLQKVKAVINSKREFQLKPQFLRRWNLFFAWQRIKAGVFKDVPQDWWKWKHVAPGDMTVDLGREGRLLDDRVSTNKMSIEAYHGLSGEDAGDVEDENLAVIKRRMKKLAALNAEAGTDFAYFDIWPRTPNVQAPADTAATDQPSPEDAALPSMGARRIKF